MHCVEHLIILHRFSILYIIVLFIEKSFKKKLMNMNLIVDLLDALFML